MEGEYLESKRTEVFSGHLDLISETKLFNSYAKISAYLMRWRGRHSANAKSKIK